MLYMLTKTNRVNQRGTSYIVLVSNFKTENSLLAQIKTSSFYSHKAVQTYGYSNGRNPLFLVLQIQKNIIIH